MHISEGVLSPPLLVSGWALASAGLAYGLRRTHPDSVPRVALLAAAFFVVSFVRIPMGPAHAHLIMNGLAGILLGWSVVPAIFIALLLQAVLFQFGGLAVLGVNACILAGPAVVMHYVYRIGAGSRPARVRAGWTGGVAGSLAVLSSLLMMAGSLWLTEHAFRAAAIGLIIAHIPLILIEGVITAFTIWFLYDVKRDMLPGGRALRP